MDLSKLYTSLTKYGAHQLAELLRTVPAGDLLDVIEAQVDTAIDLAQARKNLSVDKSRVVPDVWDRARARGGDAIDALVLIGVVFNHHELIDALANGRRPGMTGRLSRNAVDNVKAFTNLKRMLVDLGFSTHDSPDRVDYDFGRLLTIDGLGALAFDLLLRKMRTAKWDGSTDPIDEMIAHGFHRTLAMPEATFREWLSDEERPALSTDKDDDYFSGADETPTKPFVFVAGHKPRKTGRVARTNTSADTEAELLHNEIQTALYEQLVREHGEAAVGTEQSTGLGTSVDVVVQLDDGRVFYEIKIASSVRACIRQALPQLMEYAYWRCSDDIAQRLVIVGTHPLTDESRAFLDYLRRRFQIPITYEQFQRPAPPP